MRLLHLRGRKTNDSVLRKGRTWKGKTMTVRWVPGAPRNAAVREGVFVGTFASTKLSKKAVERNRMRRRCREALRLAMAQRGAFPTGQLLLCPRPASLRSPFADLQADVHSFLSTIQ